MLFGLLIVLPVTVIVWIILKIFYPRLTISFERLHDGVGLVIIGLWIAAFFVAIIAGVAIQIGRHPWVLLILVPLSIVVTLVDRSETRARRARNAQDDRMPKP